ncbi:hypothetical protein PtB15_12B229 [Puccinia triticina]|nr:hypothetical protein PtB15_12B229 [Puccinia triticina]
MTLQNIGSKLLHVVPPDFPPQLLCLRPSTQPGESVNWQPITALFDSLFVPTGNTARPPTDRTITKASQAPNATAPAALPVNPVLRRFIDQIHAQAPAEPAPASPAANATVIASRELNGDQNRSIAALFGSLFRPIGNPAQTQSDPAVPQANQASELNGVTSATNIAVNPTNIEPAVSATDPTRSTVPAACPVNPVLRQYINSIHAQGPLWPTLTQPVPETTAIVNQELPRQPFHTNSNLNSDLMAKLHQIEQAIEAKSNPVDNRESVAAAIEATMTKLLHI